MRAIGYEITLLRKKRRLTQAGLARRSGVPQPNLSRIERGEQDPTVSTLLRICRALQIPAAELFREKAESSTLGRASLERLARGVLGSPVRLSAEERKIAGLVRDLIPEPRRRPLSGQRVYAAWQELKNRLPEEKIRVLFERVQDERTRQERAR